MKSMGVWAFASLSFALSGCLVNHSGDDRDSGDTSNGGSVEFYPEEGAWTFGSGSWVSDECEATFLSSAIGWTLSNLTDTSFDLSIAFAEAGSMLAEPSCTLSASEFTCETVVQQFSVGSGSVTLDATGRGGFLSETTADFEVQFDIECSGSGCGNMLSANPCTSVQSFNVFFDG